MKTSRLLTLASIIIIIIIILINSCKRDYHSEGFAEQQLWGKKSDTIRGNQFIYRFDDTVTYEQKLRAFEKIKKLGQKFIDSCACSNLYLFGYDYKTIIDPDGRLHSSDEQAAQEGGKAFFNLSIDMDLPFNDETLGKDTSQICIDLSERDVKVVAVVDGGISDKFDLEQSRWTNSEEAGYGKDSIDNDGNCYIDDLTGVDFATPELINPPMNMHGTIISHILMSSLADSDIDVELMDLRIFNEKGEGNLFDAMCAIDYAIKNEVDFMNLSWGYYRKRSDTSALKADSLLLDYLLAAKDSGIVVFASAGNQHENTDLELLHFPSGFYKDSDKYFPHNLISVTALDPKERELDGRYSNFGDKSVFIATQGTFKFDRKKVDGTSYSTPKALAYALMLRKPDDSALIPLEIKKCIYDQVVDKSFQIKTEGLIDPSKTICR